MTNGTLKRPSRMACSVEEETNAAAVMGMREAAKMRSNDQWYEP